MIYFRGNPDAPIVVVTDVLSRDEAAAAEPFYGPTGAVYDSMLSRVGIEAKNVVYINGFNMSRESLNRSTKEDIEQDLVKYLFPYLAQSPRKAVMVLGKKLTSALKLTKGNESMSSVRERVNSVDGINAPIVVSTHPYFITSDPETMNDVVADFRLIRRILDGNLEIQVPMIKRLWKTPQDIRAFITRIETNEFKAVSYDNETTGLDEKRDIITCTSFHAGEIENGKRIAYLWQGYDKLDCEYSYEDLSEIKNAFAELFNAIDKSKVKQWGWHIDFDDWMEDTWLEGRTTVRSDEDGMVMSWIVDNSSNNKLKANVYKYLGYPKYDSAIDEEFKGIKERRGRILKDPDDLKVLELMGLEPEVNERTGSKRWPKGADKGAYGYALIDKEMLGHYCCYDAVYTYMLCEKLAEIIDKEGLRKSCDFRHGILNELYISRKNGMYVSKEKLDKARRQLIAIRNSSMEEFFSKIGERINLNSTFELSRVLFGDKTFIPTYEPQKLYEEFKSRDVDEIVRALLNKCYGNYEKVKQSVRDGSFDYGTAQSGLISEFNKYYPELKGKMLCVPVPIYCKGMFSPPLFTKTGLPSVARIALEVLYDNVKEGQDKDILKLILMNRRAMKLLGTFIDGVEAKLDANGILRPRGNAIGTNTGRISVAGPNTQNWPAPIRGIVSPRKEGRKFVTWDLSQAEVRVLAAMSGDSALMKATEAPGGIHKNIAALIFNKTVEQVTEQEKKYSKTIVFGILYGMSASSLALKLGISVEDAERLINDKFYKAFPIAKQWLDDQKKSAGKAPYYVYTPLGTRRTTINILSSDIQERGHIERVATNMPIQGGAGELPFYYMQKMRNRCNNDADRTWFSNTYMINTTHDSVTYEVPDQVAAERCVVLCKQIVSEKVDIPPLDKVKFDIDIDIKDSWYGEVNIYKAVDPSKDYFNWSLIKLDAYLDEEEANEIMELAL